MSFAQISCYYPYGVVVFKPRDVSAVTVTSLSAGGIIVSGELAPGERRRNHQHQRQRVRVFVAPAAVYITVLCVKPVPHYFHFFVRMGSHSVICGSNHSTQVNASSQTGWYSIYLPGGMLG